MKNIGVGIIEGFFGPEWSWDDRSSIVKFLAEKNGQFYIYAPKRDSFLRKNWQQQHPKIEFQQLLKLSAECEVSGVQFGVGLSPFELHSNWNDRAKRLLQKKLSHLQQLDFQYLGLFFDDMKGSAGLAEKQVDIIEFVTQHTDKTLLFCPTYYSYDPILDKVFGERPSGYLETLGSSIPKEVMMFWTGPKVISEVISKEHLKEVAGLLQRKPIIWENYFANDGPKNCKFLKLKPYMGRSVESLHQSSGWAFNLMNQPNLSKLVFLAAYDVLNGSEPQPALLSVLTNLGGKDFSKFVFSHQSDLLKLGLDNLEQKMESQLRDISAKNSNYGADVLKWLNGQYNVGAECLTD